MIEGKLVDLVPFEDDFAVHFENWMNEESWFQMRFWDRREPHTEYDVKKFIEKVEKNDHAALIGFQAKNGDPIGGVMFDHEWTRVRKADVMYFVGDSRYEDTDEVVDALLMIMRYCFETRNLHRLDASALAVDDRRKAVIERVGFTHEGTLRQHVRWNGGYVDVRMYGLLEDEWPGYEKKAESLNLQASNLEAKPKPEKKEAAKENGS